MLTDKPLDAGAPETEIEVACDGTIARLLGYGISEGTIIRTEITEAMVLAGVGALADCEDKKAAGKPVTDADLVCAVYAAMRFRS
jgi:hypothetical protein